MLECTTTPGMIYRSHRSYQSILDWLVVSVVSKWGSLCLCNKKIYEVVCCYCRLLKSLPWWWLACFFACLLLSVCCLPWKCDCTDKQNVVTCTDGYRSIDWLVCFLLLFFIHLKIVQNLMVFNRPKKHCPAASNLSVLLTLLTQRT